MTSASFSGTEKYNFASKNRKHQLSFNQVKLKGLKGTSGLRTSCYLSFMQSDEKTVLCSAEDGWQVRQVRDHSPTLKSSL